MLTFTVSAAFLFFGLVLWSGKFNSYQLIEGMDKLISIVIQLQLMLFSLSPTEKIHLSGLVCHRGSGFPAWAISLQIYIVPVKLSCENHHRILYDYYKSALF